MIVVDDTLAEIGRYEGDFSILAVGSSRDNNLWIYDGLDYRLKKISSDNEVLLESNPLESYHQLDIQPNYVIENGNMVYLVQEHKGIVIFDNFGTFSRYIPLNASSIQVRDDLLSYVEDGKLSQIDMKNTFAESRFLADLQQGASVAYKFKKQVYFLEGQCLKRLVID